MINYNIEQLLPHQSPMILIDSLEHYDFDSCRCNVEITEHSPFYSIVKKGVPSYIGSEYMAQAIAAFAGAHALDVNDEVKIGFLLGSRKYKTMCSHFALDEILTITIKELYREDSGLRVFECEIINAENSILAQANINVFQPKDPAVFIQESYA
jgi:predicted hotdog family 3-hydroxylacyl-ACP dehydratase|tara:strand:- start:1117 stop:1578 length:462 start_codon:yes stop_codon:yes gene_type:complete